VPVTTGLDDDAYVQIVAGELREGDRVIVSERADSAGRGTAPPVSVIPLRR
jgi:multidrug efflux pump subunit AcrA (membrane-fusion protein)